MEKHFHIYTKKETNCIYQHYKEQQIIVIKNLTVNYNNEDIIYDRSLPPFKKKKCNSSKGQEIILHLTNQTSFQRRYYNIKKKTVLE